jgi:MFS transporter, DHA3 family, tetracycline resistance protein
VRRIRSLLAPLVVRDFVLVWLGQGVSQVGDRCTEIALIWLIVGLTGSSLLLGSVLTAMYIPTLLLLLAGGLLADRGSRRMVVLLSDALRAIVIGVFAALVTFGMVSLPDVFALAVIYGVVRAFFNPALSALYPSLVAPEHYDAANSLRQIVLQAATLGGPALGGYLIARWSVGAAFVFDALTFVVSFLALAFLRRRVFGSGEQAHHEREGGAGRRWREIFGGLRFLRGEHGLLILVLFFALVNGVNNVEAVLVPRLVRRDLGLSAAAFGLLASSMGLGTLLGALFSGLFARGTRRRAHIICLSIMVFGVAIVAMGMAQNALTLYLAYFVLGVSFILAEVVFTSFLQRIVPTALQGRVFSFLALIAMSMNPVGLLLAGVLGDQFGPRAGLWIGGGAIAVLSLLALAIPAVRALNGRDDAPPSAVPSAPRDALVTPTVAD